MSTKFENTFKGTVEHYKPRQVVKFCINDTELSCTVHEVHIMRDDSIEYDLEVWALGNQIIKGIQSKHVSTVKL